MILHDGLGKDHGEPSETELVQSKTDLLKRVADFKKVLGEAQKLTNVQLRQKPGMVEFLMEAAAACSVDALHAGMQANLREALSAWFGRNLGPVTKSLEADVTEVCRSLLNDLNESLSTAAEEIATIAKGRLTTSLGLRG